MLLIAMVCVSFNYHDGITKEIFGQSIQFKHGISPGIMNLKGTIVSIQNNDSVIQTWITSGRWKLSEMPTAADNTSAQNTSFSANLTMVKIDATNSHKHKLRDLKLTGLDFKNATTTINGTITLTTDDQNNVSGLGNQPINEVPVKIQVFNNRTITVDMDKNKVKNHFGNLPIYGIVS
jgi:hypothetical protein